MISVSNSEIQTWKGCRRRWWLTYYRELGLRPDLDDPTGVRNLGARIHAALQALYERGVDPIAAIDEIYADDIRKLAEAGMEDKITKLQDERDLAHAMLEGYLQWLTETAADAGYEIIASEQIIEVPSGIPGVMLRGVVDQQRRHIDTGVIEFVDFKTTASFDQLKKTLPIDEQSLHYHLILQLFLGRTIDAATYRMLRRVKRTTAAQPPFYADFRVEHNAEMIRNTWISVHAVLSEIIRARAALDAGEDHHYWVPKRVSRECTYQCDYLDVCPLFDDGSNVEGFLAEYYVHRDPHERYHRDQESEKAE